MTALEKYSKNNNNNNFPNCCLIMLYLYWENRHFIKQAALASAFKMLQSWIEWTFGQRKKKSCQELKLLLLFSLQILHALIDYHALSKS